MIDPVPLPPVGRPELYGHVRSALALHGGERAFDLAEQCGECGPTFAELSSRLLASPQTETKLQEKVETLTRRLAVIPDCPVCRGKGGWGNGRMNDAGDYDDEMCDACGGSGKLLASPEPRTQQPTVHFKPISQRGPNDCWTACIALIVLADGRVLRIELPSGPPTHNTESHGE